MQVQFLLGTPSKKPSLHLFNNFLSPKPSLGSSILELDISCGYSNLNITLIEICLLVSVTSIDSISISTSICFCSADKLLMFSLKLLLNSLIAVSALLISSSSSICFFISMSLFFEYIIAFYLNWFLHASHFQPQTCKIIILYSYFKGLKLAFNKLIMGKKSGLGNLLHSNHSHFSHLLGSNTDKAQES